MQAQRRMSDGRTTPDGKAVGIPGRPLDRADRRAAIEAALRSRPGESDRAIAGDLGVDHKTVGGVREVAEATGEIPQFETRKGKDGKARRRPPPRPNTASSAIDVDLAARVAALERCEAVNAVVAVTVAKICKHIGLDTPLPPLGSEWILIKEAAARVGYSESGIRNLIRRGKVESMVTPAGRIRIRAASLRSAIEQVARSERPGS
jgi:hypothetical protein